MTEIQAQAILDMKLQRLTGLERDKIVKDYEDTLKEIERLKEILGSEKLVSKIIKDELVEIKNKYGGREKDRDCSRDCRVDHRGPHHRRRYGHHPFAQRLYKEKSAFYLQKPASRWKRIDGYGDKGRGLC